MGTETILQHTGATGVGHHQQQQPQQRQHNQSDGNDGAFGGDLVKAPSEVATHPQLNVFSNNHPHIHPPPGSGTKLPAVVGIYRPPAARRALKLAEKAFHQLAPPAACENPTEYIHHPTTRTTSKPARDPSDKEVTTSDKALSAPATTTVCTESGISSLPRLGKDEGKNGEEKTGPTSEGSSKCQTQASSPISDGSQTDCSSVVSPTNARVNRPHRERRPDRAVYIPRARRSLTTPPVTTSSLLPSTAASGEPASKITTSATSNPTVSPPKGTPRLVAGNRAQPLHTEAVAAVSVSTEGTANSRGKQRTQNSPPAPSVEHSSVKGQLQSNASSLNCDTVIEESSKRRAAQLGEHRLSAETFKKRSYSLEEQDQQYTGTGASYDDRLQIVTEVSCGSALPKRRHQPSSADECTKESCDIQHPISTGEDPSHDDRTVFESKSDETNDITTMHRNNNRNRNAKNVATMPATTAPASMIINGRPAEGEKIDRDEKELRRASQEMNRSNRRIMKQTFTSDVLEIDEPVTPASPPPPPPQAVGMKVTQNGDSKASGITGTTNGGGLPNDKSSEGDDAGDDEEDWESMYDDNGDCLNPKMLEELTSAVGKVAIEVPHSDYKSYQTKQAVLNEEEFPHVLEVSNFPAEFKTQDLMMLFSQYKESGFDIKWVDDTHALAVFSSSKIAAEVLATGHTFARVKPLAEATSESRSKARKCASSLQPYRARPETCAALARRLVTTALGVRLKTAPEERENERRVLREAKERKLLAAKQRDEVWDS